MPDGKTSTKKNNNAVPLILLLAFVTGVLFLLWPTFSNALSEITQTTAMRNYADSVEDMSDDEASSMMEKCAAYNEAVREAQLLRSFAYRGAEYDDPAYDSLLDTSGDGIMGYIEIPRIGVYLPIGHGTSSEVLDIEAGHMHGTSIITGGEGTHAAITAHTGLTSAKLFTDVDELAEGDVFYIHVLGETHKYAIDRIVTALPDEADGYLQVEDGKDYVTLYTCTPYGINTHRLLVRGVRQAMGTASVENEGVVLAQQNTKAWITAILCGLIPIGLLAAGLVLLSRKKKKQKDEETEN